MRQYALCVRDQTGMPSMSVLDAYDDLYRTTRAHERAVCVRFETVNSVSSRVAAPWAKSVAATAQVHLRGVRGLCAASD